MNSFEFINYLDLISVPEPLDGGSGESGDLALKLQHLFAVNRELKKVLNMYRLVRLTNMFCFTSFGSSSLTTLGGLGFPDTSRMDSALVSPALFFTRRVYLARENHTNISTETNYSVYSSRSTGFSLLNVARNKALL